MANSRKEKGREVEEEENKKEEESKAQKSNMAEEVQRAHHKSVINGNKERPKEVEEEGKKGEGRPKAPKQGKFLVSLESGSFSRVDSAQARQQKDNREGWRQ